MDGGVHGTPLSRLNLVPTGGQLRYLRAVDKIALQAAADGLTEFWSQHVVGAANGNLFKVAKGVGSTNWHAHADQDETFVILRGRLTIQMRDKNVELDAGDLFVVPRGVEHCPHAENEAHFMIIGPDVTSNAAGGKPTWSYTEVAGDAHNVTDQRH